MAYDFSLIKVLVVDDMAPMLILMANLLGRFGFSQVHSAKNAEEAYDLFRRHGHDLVITDWMMEPMDGLELAAKIRKDRYSPDRFVPIILMTAHADRARVELARDSGITEILIKPFTATDLYARIVQVIEKPRQFVEHREFFGPDRRRRRDGDASGAHNRRATDEEPTA